jgi:predicted amino acid-binding ACT domain protein
MSDSNRDYYTRFLSLSKPRGEHVFELLVVAKDEIGVTSKVTGEIARHKIDILSIDGANDPELNGFVFTIFCDFANADCTAEQVADEIRKFAFVTRIDYLSAKGRLFDRYRFPIKIMNKHRAILMRADPLLRVEKHIREVLGVGGDTIMFEEGKIYAHETWGRQFRVALSNAGPEETIRNVIDGLRATGWALFDFQKERGHFQVTIRNSPKLENDNGFHSMFLYGLATGVVESLTGLKLIVRDASYHQKSDTVKLTLERFQSSTRSHKWLDWLIH